MKSYGVNSLESPHRGDSNEYTQHNITAQIDNISLNYRHLLPNLAPLLTQWLELPISRSSFHGPKDVRAIEVRLYDTQKMPQSRRTAFPRHKKET